MKLPSRAKPLQWLLIAASFFWMILTGKQHFPAWGQWVCIGFWGLNTVIIPLGFFLSIKALFLSEVGGRERREMGWTGALFLFLFCITLFLQLSVVFGIDGVFSKLNSSEPDLLPKIIAQVSAAKSVQKRERMSAAAYRIGGVTTLYQLDDGSYVQYQPSAKDKESWAQAQQINKFIRSQQGVIHRQIHEILWDALIEVALFFVIVLGGILFTSYHRGKEPLT